MKNYLNQIVNAFPSRHMYHDHKLLDCLVPTIEDLDIFKRIQAKSRSNLLSRLFSIPHRVHVSHKLTVSDSDIIPDPIKRIDTNLDWFRYTLPDQFFLLSTLAESIEHDVQNIIQLFQSCVFKQDELTRRKRSADDENHILDLDLQKLHMFLRYDSSLLDWRKRDEANVKALRAVVESEVDFDEICTTIDGEIEKLAAIPGEKVPTKKRSYEDQRQGLRYASELDFYQHISGALKDFVTRLDDHQQNPARHADPRQAGFYQIPQHLTAPKPKMSDLNTFSTRLSLCRDVLHNYLLAKGENVDVNAEDLKRRPLFTYRQRMVPRVGKTQRPTYKFGGYGARRKPPNGPNWKLGHDFALLRGKVSTRKRLDEVYREVVKSRRKRMRVAANLKAKRKRVKIRAEMMKRILEAEGNENEAEGPEEQSDS